MQFSHPQPLEKGHDISAFDCGVEPLNIYLKKYARQNQARGASRTYVVLDLDRVVGYYTLVYGDVRWEDAPSEVQQGLGKYAVPVLVIARLAADNKMKGRGLGSALLKDALAKAVQAAEIAGLCAVVVDAKNDDAKQFYEKHGFRTSLIDSLRLFISIAELKRAAK